MIKILKNKKVTVKRLYDSDDYRGQYTQKSIQLADGELITFTPTEFSSKSFKSLLTELEPSDRERIIKEGSFSNKPPEYYKAIMNKEDFNKLQLDYYGSESGMGLTYSIIYNYLLVTTIGEKQPGRWIVIIEGVWEISD